jgi:hypothetical protein
VLAVDGRTGGVTRVPVKDGVVDVGTIGEGRLMVNAVPWAAIKIGALDVGTTPIDPIKLRAGRYVVTLTRDAKVVTRTIDVKPGAEALLRVDMR